MFAIHLSVHLFDMMGRLSVLQTAPLRRTTLLPNFAKWNAPERTIGGRRKKQNVSDSLEIRKSKAEMGKCSAKNLCDDVSKAVRPPKHQPEKPHEAYWGWHRSNRMSSM